MAGVLLEYVTSVMTQDATERKAEGTLGMSPSGFKSLWAMAPVDSTAESIKE